MLSLPLHAQNANVPEGFDSFDAYETAMYARIDELAVQIGADLNRVHEVRDELRVEYAEAERRNDRAGMAEARALQSTVIRAFLEKFSAVEGD